ncbi:MAG: LamG domain-containing protein [Patescibacteria group bacterium]
MRKKITPIPIIVALLLIGLSAYGAVKILGTANRGLMLNWKLDEGTGTTLADNSGNSVSGTLYGATPPSWIEPGRFGEALSFDGNDQYAESNSSIESLGIADAPYTISAWAKIDPGETNGNIVHISNSENGLGWCIPFLAVTDGKFSAISFDGSAKYATEQDTPTTNIWHHVVTTWNSTEGLKLYVDGVLKATTAQPTFAAAGNSIYVQLARGASCTADTGFFSGSIDDVRVYNRALSAGQVRALRSSNTDSVATILTSPTKDGLTGWWSFEPDTISGSTVDDVSGGGNNGTSSNSPGSVDGKIGKAFEFNGANQYIDISRPATDDFTICSWFKTTSVGSGTNHWQSMAILDTEVGGVTNDFGFGVDSNGKLVFGDGNSNIGDYTFSSTATVNTGSWVSGCVTREKTSGEIKLYVNGVLSGGGTGSTLSLNANGSARIGFGFDSAYYWNGDLDEVRVYDRVLSANEINNLYHSGGNTTINDSRNSRITDGLQGLWSFDGKDTHWINGSEADIYDRSGENNDGTLSGADQKNSVAPGVIGQAFDFNTGNQCITTSAVIFNNPTAFTIAGWIYPRNYDHTSFFGQNDTIEFGFDGSNNIAGWTQSSGNILFDADAAPLNKWSHVAFVGDGSKQILYINGQNVSQTNASVGNYVTDNPDTFSIGCNVWGGFGDFFDGEIDDVRAYTTALTSDQIKQLYLMGK